MFDDTTKTIARLLRSFPNSSWADDAQVLNYQTYTAATGRTVTSIGTGQSSLGNFPAVVNQNLLTATTVAGTSNISQSTQLDREDEIKLAAFQSLFVADPKKAIEVLGNLLRTDSKASETLKLQILRTLRSSSRFYFNQGSGNYPIYELTPKTVVTEIYPILRETLVKSFQNESNVKIRTEIIYSIASINDEPSLNYLVQLYSTENSKDVKKAVINSFGSSYYSFGTFAPAIATTVNKGQVEETVATHTTTNKNDTNPIRKIRFDKLIEIVRIEKDLELRRLAFYNVQRFAGWSAKEGMVEILSQMYDAEKDEAFKMSIIQSFSGIKNSQAKTKLINIAKSDASDKLRLEAIRSLRNSNDPEVIKFLESLIN